MFVPKIVPKIAEKLELLPPTEVMESYPYKLAKLHDKDGDTSKRWRIEFYVYDHGKQKKVRRYLAVVGYWRFGGRIKDI